jgi:hypothetical protein
VSRHRLGGLPDCEPHGGQMPAESGELTVLVEDLGLEIGPFGIIVRRGHKLSPGAQIMLTALRETATYLYSDELHAGSD